jgi:hypothetical protein
MLVAIAGERGDSSGAAGRSASGGARFFVGSAFCALFALLLLLVPFIIVVVVFWAVSVCLLPFYADGVFTAATTAVKRHTSIYV